MGNARKVKSIIKSASVIEGAGVRLKRAFGFRETPLLDPFLLLDDFHSGRPEDYLAGFPWHPHRGIETITYVLEGEVEHWDSMGNRGVIAAGDLQWMTAGSGIIHEEMPRGNSGGVLRGFQLWANLPASKKIMEPRYRGISAGQVPVIKSEDGIIIKLICGELNGIKGPAEEIIIDPEYLDVTVPENTAFRHHIRAGYTVFAYTMEGAGYFDAARDKLAGSETLVLYGDGEEVEIKAEKGDLRFLLVSGRPLGEPVAWYGPIVMNTQEELETAFDEYKRGAFIKNISNKPQA